MWGCKPINISRKLHTHAVYKECDHRRCDTFILLAEQIASAKEMEVVYSSEIFCYPT